MGPRIYVGAPVIEIRSATEDEVISAFLQAEVDSTRYGGTIVDCLKALGRDRALIDTPVLTDANENGARRRILSGYRGYPDRFLFQGFPSDVLWRRVQLQVAEFSNVRYANHPVFLRLSAGSRAIADGASNFKANPADHPAMAHVSAVLAAYGQGLEFAPLIMVEGPDRAPILIEGHTRATVYVIAGHTGNVDAFVGFSLALSRWIFY